MYDIVGYISMKSLTCIHIHTCLTYVVLCFMVCLLYFVLPSFNDVYVVGPAI